MPYLNTNIQLRHNLAHFWYLSEAKVQKFVSGAPEDVVNAERTKLATQQDIIAKYEAALKELK